MDVKFESECFDGRGDFGLWRQKMKALLVQQKVAKALLDPGKLPVNLTEDEKEAMHEIAYSSIILHLYDNVVWRVSKVEKVIDLWEKLEELYMPKTVSNKIYLKDWLFRFKMDLPKNHDKNLNDFNTICT